MVKNHKLGVGVAVTLTAATAITLTILGFKHWGKKGSGGDPNKGKDITQENVKDPKGTIKEHNEKIINDAIDKNKNDVKANADDPGGEVAIALAKGIGIKTKLTGEDEKQLRDNIDKIKNLILNQRDYFKNNFVNYSQVRNIELKNNIPKAVDLKNTENWEEANKMFSFDSIYNMLNDLFSDSVKLVNFKLGFDGNLFTFKFNNDVSIDIDFKKDLAIRYSTKEFKNRIFKFKMPKDN